MAHRYQQIPRLSSAAAFFTSPFAKLRSNLLVTCIIGAIITICWANNPGLAYGAETKGGIVTVANIASNEGQINAIFKELANEQAKKLAQSVSMEQLTNYQKLPPSENQGVDQQETQPLLIYQLEGVKVDVNGVTQFYFIDNTIAEKFLAELKETHKVNAKATVEFADEVEIVTCNALVHEMVTISQALKKAKETGKIPYYEVEDGDTIWDIATANGLTEEELLAANPGFEPELMQIGQKLKLAHKQPIISMICTYEKTEDEEIPIPTEVRRNDTMVQGESNVLEAGKAGLKTVTYRIIAKDGEEIERKARAAKVIKEPVPKVVEEGTRVLVPTRNFGGGRLAKPCGGYISSSFGSRWGRMHEGLDLAASTGSPVVAAELGTVIRAGWNGGYGKCIEISHGGGMVTRYAHLSSIDVTVGKSVQRGEIIGAVGNTGRSTGPHLHFEVRINGTPYNPMNYL